MRTLSTRRASTSQKLASKARKRSMAWALIAFVVGHARRFRRHAGRRGSEQIVVKHRAGNRCGGLRAKATVFDQNCERDAWMIRRRIGEIPCVVAQALVEVARLVLLA